MRHIRSIAAGQKQDLVVEVDEGVGYPLELPRQKILELLRPPHGVRSLVLSGCFRL